MNKMIIEQPYGGLGDNLQFSTIPELCSEKGIECYISNKNTYRNQGIKELVWDCNPFVKGYTDEMANAGSSVYKVNSPSLGSIVNVMEYSHGFNSTNNLPKIYYNPLNITEFNELILIDFSSHSAHNLYKKHLDRFNKILQNYDKKQIKILAPINDLNSSYYHRSLDNGYEVYNFKDIFEYTNLIYSCKKFICLFSGSSVLSAAVGRYKENIDVECYVPQRYKIDFNSNSYFFKNIKYKEF